MSLAKLLGSTVLIALILAFALPSVKINGKSTKDEEWTSAHERQLRSQCPAITPAELAKFKR